jgi:hypothetical protein
MNLFARILSHGFALVLVALLALGLVYRGDLFPGLQLPAFLTFKPAQQHGTEASPATTSGTAPASTPEEPSAKPQPGVAVVATEAPTGAPGTEAESTAQDREITPPPVPAGNVAGNRENEAPAPDLTQHALPPAGSESTEMEPAAAEQPPAPAMPAGPETPPEATPEMPPAPVPAEPASASEPPPPATPASVSSDSGLTTAAGPGAAGMPQETEPGSPTEAAPETGVAGPESSLPVGSGQITQEPGAAPVPAQQPGPSGMPGGKSSPYQVLEAARESYWLRDYATAEKQYNDLISMDPDNPDGYGELGNMYFSQGEWGKASAAYYEAGVRLLQQGMITEAQQLVEVIRGLKGTQADALEEKVKESSASAP